LLVKFFKHSFLRTLRFAGCSCPCSLLKKE
jgi:hypothetical protein